MTPKFLNGIQLFIVALALFHKGLLGNFIVSELKDRLWGSVAYPLGKALYKSVTITANSTQKNSVYTGKMLYLIRQTFVMVSSVLVQFFIFGFDNRNSKHDEFLFLEYGLSDVGDV